MTVPCFHISLKLEPLGVICHQIFDLDSHGEFHSHTLCTSSYWGENVWIKIIVEIIENEVEVVRKKNKFSCEK